MDVVIILHCVVNSITVESTIAMNIRYYLSIV